jgi:hypothetical protein
MSESNCLHSWTLALADQGFTYCESCKKAVELKYLSSLDLILSVNTAIKSAFENICKAHTMLGKEYVLFGPYNLGAVAFNGIPDVNLTKLGNLLLTELTEFQQAVSKEDALYPIILNVMTTKGCKEKIIPGYDIEKHTNRLSWLLSEFSIAALARDGYDRESAQSFIALNGIESHIPLLQPR